MTPRPQRAVRPKPVKMWCVWVRGADKPHSNTFGHMKETAEKLRRSCCCSDGEIVQVTITRAVRGKKRKA